MKHTSIGIIAAVLVMLFVGSASAWYSDYGYRIPLNIDNTAGSALTNYQLNVSLAGIDADSIRVVNETTGTTIPHWCETVTGDDCYEVWFNVTNLPAGVWTNSTYYIYYHKYGDVCASDFDTTFTKKYDDTGLVLELHMDDGTGTQVTDTSGEGNHGTMVNAVSPFGWQGVDGGQWDNRSEVTFATGDHIGFGGSAERITCGNSTTLDLNTTDFSIGLWIKSPPATGYDVVGKFDTTDGGYSISIAANTLIIFYGTSGQYLYASGSIVDEWTHYVCTRDGSDIRWYKNGVPNSAGDTGASFFGNSENDLGVRCNGYYNTGFTGHCDEVRIYNRSLSGEEIYRQYIRSKYTPDPPSTSLGVTETYIPIVEEQLEGWQGLGQDAVESYSDMMMIISVCVLILVVGGIIIGLRSFAGDVSPEAVIMVAIAIGFGLLLLITMTEVVPSVMAPMEEITMEGL